MECLLKGVRLAATGREEVRLQRGNFASWGQVRLCALDLLCLNPQYDSVVVVRPNGSQREFQR